MTPRQEALLSKDISQGHFIAATILIIAGSLAGAAFELGRPSLWVDEAFTWFFVTMPWEDMFRAVRLDAVNPPAYYVFAKLIVELWGTSEAAIRAPSILAHVFGLAGSFWLGHLVANRIGAVIAGWFWGFHPMMLWFARDARPYSLAAALAAWTLALYLIIQRDNALRPGFLALAVLTVSLGLLTHFFFLPFAGCTALLAIRQLRIRPQRVRWWLLILVLGLVPLLAWLWWFLQLPNPSFGIGWIQAPDPADLLATAWNLLSGYGASISVGSTVFGLMATMLLAAGLTEAWRAAILALGAPLLGIWLFSQFRPVYVDRYFVVLLPFFALFAAKGGWRLWEQWVRRSGSRVVPGELLISGVLTLAAILAVVNLHRSSAYQKEDWRELARWLDEQPVEVRLLISEPELQLPLAYYSDQRKVYSTIDQGSCHQECIWVLRQPYTATHAFTQSVQDPRRPDWKLEPETFCDVQGQSSRGETGITAWHLTCEP